MKNRKTLFVTSAAVIAALYVALTALSNVMGLAYGEIQCRISEAMTVLPVFFPAAIPGLTIGCLLSNITSTISPADMIFGTAATLLAALLTAALRKVTVKKYPFLSFLMPVLANGFIVAAELLFLYTDASERTFSLYWVFFAEVAAGEAIAVFVFGTILWAAMKKLTEKNPLIKELTYKEKIKNG